MNLLVVWALKVLAIIVAAGGVVFMHKKYNTPEDNLIEEYVESELKKELNIAIDLSPDSPDPDDASK